MTSYPATGVRPGPAHLLLSQVTTGQPVTVRSLSADGKEIEFPAVYVRSNNKLHMWCAREGENGVSRYRPSQVFPRKVIYRRWAVTLQRKDGELVPVHVPARTELEARYTALLKIRSQHGQQANWSYRLHSVEREG